MCTMTVGPLPVQGSCSGYSIHSEISFQTLRAGVGARRLPVVSSSVDAPDGELLARWEPRPDNPFHGRLLRSGSTFAFWASDAGWYLVDPAKPSVELAGHGDGLSLTAEVRLFGVPTSLIAIEQGDVCLHAAAVEIRGRAVLLAGPSHHGKTTLAAGFTAAGHRLLTEDMTHVALRDTPAVYPGPAVARLRPDVAGGVSVAGSSTRVTERERVFALLDDSRRGSGDPVALDVILLLRSGPGPSAIRPAPRVDAVRDLWSLAFTLPTDSGRASSFERVASMVSAVPVFNLHRTLSLDAMPDVIDLIERHVGASAGS